MSHASDDELLNKAIPIDPADLAEEEPIEVVPEEEDEELTPVDLIDEQDEQRGKNKIRTFGPSQRVPHDEHWKRTPNATGTGAIHVKTFVTKLRLDAINHLDEQVNEWLDAHPEYEVKFVTTTIGKLVAKNTEDALFMNIWV